MKKWKLIVDEDLMELYDESFFEEEPFGMYAPSEVLRDALVQGILKPGKGVQAVEVDGVLTLQSEAEVEPNDAMTDALMNVFRGLLDPGYIFDYVGENLEKG